MIDKATLSGIVDRMVEGGWLIKRSDEQDKRFDQAFPSEKAYDLKDKLVKERELANAELLAGFTLEERASLKRLLLRLLQEKTAQKRVIR